MQTINLPAFVIIISTQLNDAHDKNMISGVMGHFSSVSEWSLDLEDPDQVLRIISQEEISEQVLSAFALKGIRASLMEVFDKEPEISSHPADELTALLTRLY